MSLPNQKVQDCASATLRAFFSDAEDRELTNSGTLAALEIFLTMSIICMGKQIAPENIAVFAQEALYLMTSRAMVRVNDYLNDEKQQ